jgi:type 1 glutamine amidotransferase
MRFITLLLAFFLTQCWAAERPKLVFISGEYEYHSKDTLPPFAKSLEDQFNVQTTFLSRPEDEKKQTIPGLDALDDASLVVLFVRRMTLPEDELNRIKKYLHAGKPLVALRTSSHAFENWKEFDRDVLGGNYGNHYGNQLKTSVSIIPTAKGSPLVRDVSPFLSDGSLYKNTPLRPGAKPVLIGTVEGQAPEPIAWTHNFKGARIFYTSLGHPNDFKQESFRNLLRNAIEWTLQQPLKAKEK